jgi:hypothetical protein
MRHAVLARLGIVALLLGGCAWHIRLQFVANKGLVVDQGVVQGTSQTGKYSDSRWSIESGGVVVATGRCGREHQAFALMKIGTEEVPVGACFDSENAEAIVYESATKTVWIADVCSYIDAVPFWKNILADYYDQSPHFSSYDECRPDSKI